jgi:hypothetical protein
MYKKYNMILKTWEKYKKNAKKFIYNKVYTHFI